MIGIVLLIGMVGVTSSVLFLTAGEVLTNTEAQTEAERVEPAFVELSQKMGSARIDSDVTHSMDLDAGERGAVARAETGWINVSSAELDGPINETIGTVEWEGDDGSRIAYESGAVFSGTGNETRVVSVPPIYYDARTETLTLPVTTINGETMLDSGDISVSHERTTVYADANVENAEVRITITSEYYRGWERFFTREAGDTVVRDVDHENQTVSIRLGYLDIEDAFDSGVTLSEPAEESGEVDYGNETVRHEQMPELDDVIERMLEDMENDEYYDDVEEVGSITDNETFTNGTYLADEVVLDDNTDEVTFDLSDGNATLMVDGDVSLNHTGSALNVENATGTNNSLKIYSTGNLSTNGDMGGSSATHMQVYGTSEMYVAMRDGSFTGTIYAPSNDWTGTNPIEGGCDDEQICILSNVDFTGAIVTSTAHFQGGLGGINFEYDDDLGEEPVTLYPDEYDLPPQLTYLNVAHHEIDVENT
ncbi:DUF7289 family protein [Halosolutus halophilus]|uniref:DUF7289 family protein n=1 Tax=Halosolutus halophilus TaxID=1552990 RepID=UPI0022352573|nr:hypothetical protein [Halosolutus halophilus]